MAKTKPSKKEHNTQKLAKKMTANGHGKTTDTPAELYASALTLVEQSQPEEALKEAKKLLSQVQNRPVTEVLPALNLLGEISIELGDANGARQYFERAVVLDPDGSIPEAMGGGAEKFLWLAQLCEEGGKASVEWFEKGAKALQAEIMALDSGSMLGMDDESLMVMRVEKKRKLANALCGIVEVYMTDLSWEEDAEAQCESLVTEAMTVEDETSPEILQTLASVRLSQQRKVDAQSALTRSLESWKYLDLEDSAVPDFSTRISLSRLLMEAEMENEAMDVLDRLLREDDQSVEAWYLGGWCQHLIVQRLKDARRPIASTTAANGTDKMNTPESIESGLKGSRVWLQMSLKLYQQLEYEDDRLYGHAKELVTELDMVLGPEDEDAEAGDDDLEEWDGLEDEDAEDEEMKDS